MTIGRVLKYLAILVVVGIISLVIAWNIYHREISPTVLNTEEIEAVDQKLSPIMHSLKEGEVPRSQTLIITQRELNGYLNHHTKHGKTVKFTLLDGYIHADIYMKVPAGSPVLPNRKIRAVAEIKLSAVDGLPEIHITSVSSMGADLPEFYAKKYIGKNLYSMLVEKMNSPLPDKFVSSIKVSEGLLSLRFSH